MCDAFSWKGVWSWLYHFWYIGTVTSAIWRLDPANAASKGYGCGQLKQGRQVEVIGTVPGFFLVVR